MQKAALRRRIRKRVLDHLAKSGYQIVHGQLIPPAQLDKNLIRQIYSVRRSERENFERRFVAAKANDLIQCFANGSELEPSAIVPRLEEVHANTWQADLFRLSTLLWSIPVSRGFGRRMRFLVWDRSNAKLIGIIALGDPVFNLSARDKWIGWNVRDREERLCNVMDAYILGAVPPYSQLIGGKLIAALVASKEVNDAFRRKYLGQKGLISGRAKNPKLVLVTTTSALGRSSIYNRLNVDGRVLFQRIGFTEGWGHFHVPEDLFQRMKEFLESEGHPYANGYKYGYGPNWRIRVIREALDHVGLSQNLLNHGVRREVFGVVLADNFRAYLKGEAKRAKWRLLPAEVIGNLCLQRWIIPRSIRDHSYTQASRDQILDRLTHNGHCHAYGHSACSIARG